MRALTVIAVSGLVFGPTLIGHPLVAQQATAGDCVTIGKPDPSTAYVYQHRESTGGVTEVTQQWEEVTETGSRVRVTRGASVQVQVTQHHVVDDVSVLDSMATTSGGATSRTVFRPGAVGDPAFRACAGRTWRIPAVTATYASVQGASASAATNAGTMKIVAVRESITVPAGRFDTVHYTRTLGTPAGQSIDEYWKSIDYGVIVRHNATLPGATITEVLQATRPAGRR
jgi:hypothetical protein